MLVKIQVWDLPVRLFHWSLVIAVAAAYITAHMGGNLIDWHGRIGAAVLGLLVFRLIWGFAGSTYARFSSFFPTPDRIIAYVKGEFHSAGHNPLGALSVFALLGTLATLVGTGLFANDDIAFHGPLFNLVSKSLSDRLTGWHEIAFDALSVLLALHIAAIAFYFRFKKTNLVSPMLTGKKEVNVYTNPASTGGKKRYFLLAVLIAAIVVWSIFSGVLPQYLDPASTAPAAATPGW